MDEAHPLPWLPGLTFNLAVLLRSEKNPDEPPRLSVVQVPGRLPGLFRLPDGGGLEMYRLNDAVPQAPAGLVPRIPDYGNRGFRLTRDSELELDEEGRYDYIGTLETELKKEAESAPDPC